MNPEHRGKKLSEELLRKAIQEMEKIYPEVDQFIAKIKDTNIASIKIFSRNKFSLKDIKEGFNTYIYQTNYSKFGIWTNRMNFLAVLDKEHFRLISV